MQGGLLPDSVAWDLAVFLQQAPAEYQGGTPRTGARRMSRLGWMGLCLAGSGLLGACTEGTGSDPESPQPSDQVILNEPLAFDLFPPDNWWNQDISGAPLDPSSDALIDWLCRGNTADCPTNAHPDFGPPPYGIPYVGVGSAQERLPVRFVLYGEESDEGFEGTSGYPLPDTAQSTPGFIEGGEPGGGTSGDRHLLVVDRDTRALFELFATRWNPADAVWEAGSGAVFDLTSNDRRPEGWTSADAAGLPILPGLIKHHEVFGGREIEHAHRVTVRATNGYVWPASHRAGANPQAPPMGARLRLKASFDVSGYPAEMQRIFRSFQRYGLIVADNGSDLFVSGTMDGRWDNDVLNPAFHSLRASDFEVIELGWRGTP